MSNNELIAATIVGVGMIAILMWCGLWISDGVSQEDYQADLDQLQRDRQRRNRYGRGFVACGGALCTGCDAPRPGCRGR